MKSSAIKKEYISIELFHHAAYNSSTVKVILLINYLSLFASSMNGCFSMLFNIFHSAPSLLDNTMVNSEICTIATTMIEVSWEFVKGIGMENVLLHFRETFDLFALIANCFICFK